MVNLTVFTALILEKTTPKITAVIEDEAGTPIPGTSLATLTLTLYSMSDPPTHAIINSRNAQSVLNENGVTVDAGGNLAWQLASADTVIQDNTLPKEIHRAEFRWTYASGGNTVVGAHIIDMTVLNLEKVA